jgi:AcrR family transcriptional regulator
MAKQSPRSTMSRNEILDAAEQLMANQGFRETSISDICKASGLPVGSVYHYFKSKDGLLAAVMERGSHRFFASLPDPRELTGTPREQFDSWFEANTRMLAKQPNFLRLHLRLCLSDDRDDTISEIVHRVRAFAIATISAAFRPWVHAHYGDNAEAVTLELARYMLATVDGAFIAQHIDAVHIGEAMNRLYRFLVREVESPDNLDR